MHMTIASIPIHEIKLKLSSNTDALSKLTTHSAKHNSIFDYVGRHSHNAAWHNIVEK